MNFFRASAEDFKKIPGSPVAYWVSDKFRSAFTSNQPLLTMGTPKQGMSTCDVARFVHYWFEVSRSRTNINETSPRPWIRYNKGGVYRKWFGNRWEVVYWGNGGAELRDNGAALRNQDSYFEPFIAWSKISSSGTGFRLFEEGFLFDGAGGSLFLRHDVNRNLILACLNSCVCRRFLTVISPTINFNESHIGAVPITTNASLGVEKTARNCISFSRADWDSYETSWDFSVNPLIAAWNLEREKAGESSGEIASRDLPRDGTLQGIYEKVRTGWAANCEEMRRLETENNRIFIEAYGLQDELTPEVPWHEITLTCNPLYRYAVKNDELGIKNEELEKGRLPQVAKLEERLKADTVKELVSYAVGCMMGRYAIDKPGLVLANQGATYEDYLAQISEPAFAPDDDGIIPILEDDCFADDIVTQFHRFLRITFGERNFNANLSFIEDALGKDLRSYFVKDFYADHLQRYQKRPIYWLFSSPKGTFSALIYLHRYHPGTVGQVLGYLRSHITKIQSRVDAADRTAADSAATQGMKTRAIKERAKLVRQLKELEDYERDVLHPLAGKRIEIDLDDGVKANYPKFGKALRKIPGLE